jgi:hypothetical protein
VVDYVSGLGVGKSLGMVALREDAIAEGETRSWGVIHLSEMLVDWFEEASVIHLAQFEVRQYRFLPFLFLRPPAQLVVLHKTVHGCPFAHACE